MPEHPAPPYRALLRAAAADLETVVACVARDVGEPADAVRPAVRQVVAAVDDAEELSAARRTALREEGARAARGGEALPVLLDRYLSTGWALWEAAVRTGDTRDSGGTTAGTPEVHELARLGAALLRASDAAAAALSEGFGREAREAVARSAAGRQEFLDELLELAPGDRSGLASLTRRAIALALDPDVGRDVVVAWVGRELVEEDPLLDTVVRSIALPPRATTRQRPQEAAPVGARRGHLVALLPAGSPSGARLQPALANIADGSRWLGVRSRSQGGLAGVAGAYAEGLDALAAGRRAGVHGAIVEAGALLLERALLADPELAAAAVEHELGPLRRAARGGEALVETLDAFLAEGHNLRAAARRLDIAPRTVSYRLARVERLRGTPLDGDAWRRLSTALLVDRLIRGGEGPG